MRNPYLDQSVFIKNIYKKININNKEIPIINKYYSELKDKIQPTIDYVEPQRQLSINEMRNNIINDLRQYLINPSEFVESLVNNSDIELFYNFSKMFLKQIEGVKRIDNRYLTQLWNDFKNKLNISSSDTINTPSYLTAAQYEKALQNNRKVPSSYELDYPQIVIDPSSKVESYPNTNLKEIITMNNKIQKYKKIKPETMIKLKLNKIKPEIINSYSNLSENLEEPKKKSENLKEPIKQSENLQDTLFNLYSTRSQNNTFYKQMNDRIKKNPSTEKKNKQYLTKVYKESFYNNPGWHSKNPKNAEEAHAIINKYIEMGGSGIRHPIYKRR